MKSSGKGHSKPTIAEGIAIGRPARGEEILEYIFRYHVRLIRAPEDKILEARSLLAEKGIYCEHTTAAIMRHTPHLFKVQGKRLTACSRCAGRDSNQIVENNGVLLPRCFCIPPQEDRIQIVAVT